MLVLGIDPGTATTGYGLVRENERGDLAVVDFGVVLTPAGMAAEKRLLQLYDQLSRLFFSTNLKAARWRSYFFRGTLPRQLGLDRPGESSCWPSPSITYRWENIPPWK